MKNQLGWEGLVKNQLGWEGLVKNQLARATYQSHTWLLLIDEC